MNERLKTARKSLGLSQTEFGARIGVTDGAISRLEKGSNNLTDQMILSVCREFSINETWLRTGNGEMFIKNESNIIRQLAKEYELDELDRQILEAYLKFPDTQRKVVKNFFITLAEAVQNGTTSLDDYLQRGKETVRVFKAAHSVDNRESQITEVPRSTIDKLKAAKDVDEI